MERPVRRIVTQRCSVNDSMPVEPPNLSQPEFVTPPREPWAHGRCPDRWVLGGVGRDGQLQQAMSWAVAMTAGTRPSRLNAPRC
jgi:hypothetical protein